MLNLTSTFSDLLKKGEALDWRYIIKIEQTNGDHVNLFSNPGFESSTGDDFDNYTEIENNNGDVVNETTIVHSGSQSLKCIEGAGGSPQNAVVYQEITVVAATNYIWTFYDRGDGTNAGKYRIYDVSNAADIVAESHLTNTSTLWQKSVFPFTTPAGCVLVRLYQLSKAGTAGAIAYYDDNHLQPASNYYYYSGHEFEIVDLTSNDVVRGVLKSKDIPIIQQLNWREHKASIGGFSIQLADDGLNDAWATNPIFNRRIWIYKGTGDLSYLDDYQLEYTGICKNWTTENNVITLDIENSSLVSQKEIPVLLSDSDAAAGQSGILPDESQGLTKTLVFGDHQYDFMRETEAAGDGSDTSYDRGSNLTPCRFLGMDQDGDERWLVSANVVETIGATRTIWAFDPSLNRMVEIATAVTEQNTSAGCIISFTPNPDLYDYWLPDGSTSALTETPGAGDGTAEINNEAQMCNLNNSNAGDINIINATDPGIPTATVDIDWANYENAGTISAVSVWALANMSIAGGNADSITINAQDASGAANDFRQYGNASSADEAGATESLTCQITGKENAAGAEQNTLDIFMIYKRVTYKANNRLQIYAGVKGREYSGTWNGRKTSGNLIETPTDVIESILRDDLSLGDDNIDMDSFDAVNTELGATFIFSGAVDSRINSKVILEDLARQCKSFVFWGADDKVKMDTFYAANTTDRVIDINEIDGLPNVTQSKLSDIVNDLTLTYKKEPIQSRLIKTLSRVDDRTAAAGSQTKYNAVMTKDIEVDFIRDDTAVGLFADHWCKDDADSFWSIIHDVIEFAISANRGIDFWATTFKPLMLLELLDIIELDDADFDSVLKCNGASWSGKQFKIFWIERRKLGMIIKAFSV